MKLAIIANPVSGGGRAFKRLERYIQSWPHEEWKVELHPTRCAEHAGVLAHDLIEDPPDLLAVCGGDGTLHEVASSVPRPPFPVALLPAGTANVMAREVGIPLNPIAALEIALRRVVRHVDIGLLLGRSSRHFLLMTGVGLDAYVVSKMRPARQRLGLASFYLATLRAVATYSFAEFRVRIQEETEAATSCVIANAKTYGGGLILTPDATMNDGLLDILLVQSGDRSETIRFLLSAWLGKPRHSPYIQWRRAPAVRIEGPRGIWVQADGELVGTLPMDVTLSPQTFPLVVPK